MSKGQIIKKLRKNYKMTLDDLAERLNTTRQTIFKYENDIVTNIPSDKIELLASTFNVSPAYIMGWEDDSIEDPYIKINPSNVIEIPLYSSISCGKGLFVDENIDDYIAVPNRFIKPNKKYFANYASGDSMIGKGILNGDVLVFEEAPVLDNGQIGAFCINDDEAVCKIFRKLSNGIILLESANSNYPPIEIDIMRDNCFRVIGKLVGSYKKF